MSDVCKQWDYIIISSDSPFLPPYCGKTLLNCPALASSRGSLPNWVLWGSSRIPDWSPLSLLIFLGCTVVLQCNLALPIPHGTMPKNWAPTYFLLHVHPTCSPMCTTMPTPTSSSCAWLIPLIPTTLWKIY